MVGDTACVHGIETLVAAGGFLERQLVGAGVPEGHLLDQACFNLALHLGNLGNAPGANLVDVPRHKVLDGKSNRAAFDASVSQLALSKSSSRERSSGLADR